MSLVWLPVWVVLFVCLLPMWLTIAVALGAALLVVGVEGAARAAARSEVLRDELADPVGYAATLVVSAFRVRWWRTLFRLLTAVIAVSVALLLAPLAVLDVPECTPSLVPPACVEHRQFDVAVAYAAAGWGIFTALPGRIWELRQSGSLRPGSYPWAWRVAVWAADLAVVLFANATKTLSEGLVSSSSVVRGALFGAFFVALADLVILFFSLCLAVATSSMPQQSLHGRAVGAPDATT